MIVALDPLECWYWYFDAPNDRTRERWRALQQAWLRHVDGLPTAGQM